MSTPIGIDLVRILARVSLLFRFASLKGQKRDAL